MGRQAHSLVGLSAAALYLRVVGSYVWDPQAPVLCGEVDPSPAAPGPVPGGDCGVADWAKVTSKEQLRDKDGATGTHSSVAAVSLGHTHRGFREP